MSDIIETPIFVTSIFHKIIDDINLKELSTIVLKYKEENKNCSRSGISSFQSDYFINYDNSLVEYLFKCHILPMADHIIKAIWNYNRTYSSLEYWYNVNDKYSYNMQHNHVGAVLSGAFYIKVPENSGNITFVRSESEVNELAKFINPNNTNYYTHSRYWSNAIEGKLVIFPSHIPHYVEQNLSEEQRISLSFNLMP